MNNPHVAYRQPTVNRAAALAVLLLAGAAVSPAALAQSGRIELPSIGNPADRYLSPAKEIKLGENFLRNVYRHGAVLEDPEVSSYIQHLGNGLSNTLASSEHKFTLFVVNDSSVNAFAVPGGFIGVNAGLILASDTESELAAVLAHEIAHVSQRHLARRLADASSSQVPTLGAILAGLLIASNGSSDAGSAVMLTGLAAQQQQLLNFSRDMEIEADRIGLDILYHTGFDPRGMPAFFRTLQRNRHGSIPKEFEFLVTHPLDSVRITEAQNRIDRLPPQTHHSSSYYQFAKARLQALASDNPATLVQNLEKDLTKNKKPSVYQRYAFSQALERKNQFEQAKAILLELNKQDKENMSYQLGLARAYTKSGNFDSAQVLLEKMLALYPDDYAINFYYAKTLLQAGKAELGKNSLKKYLMRYSPPTTEIYKVMAELHLECGEPIESKKTLAEYYFNTGNPNAAVFQLQSALREPGIDVVTRSQIENRLHEILEATRS